MRKTISLLLFFFGISGFAYADPPKKVLKLSELKPGTKAIGFSVFHGVEPEPFDVVLGETMEQMGSRFILAGISGGPMETPLEKIGAISGMSGSPIFVGCLDLDDCVKNGTLVGALSYSIGYFIEGGMNVLLTPAENMLGVNLGGYVASGQFSNRTPNKINVGGREFTNLMLFPGLDKLSTQPNPAKQELQGSYLAGSTQPESSGRCDGSIKSKLKPGSMVTVFLATGTMNFGGSGTVTWVDGDKIYIFGHPFFGTGMVGYPFVHVGVAATVQTPFQAYKIAGCSLETEGAMLVDGAYEMAGVIGKVVPTVPLRVELHINDRISVLDEQVAASPMARQIINKIPQIWATSLFGDVSSLSLAYQIRIALTDEPEVFLKNIIPSGVVVDAEGSPQAPLSELFDRTDKVFGNLQKTGLEYRIEGIRIHADFVNNLKVWRKKTVFLSQKVAVPGETVYVNVVLEQTPGGTIKQISIPVQIPENFIIDRITQTDPSNIIVMVQSSLKFTDKRPIDASTSVEGVVAKLKQNLDLPANVLYVQQIMPKTKTYREMDRASAKAQTKIPSSWTDMDLDGIKQLPSQEDTEVIFSTTPLLNNFIDFDATLSITVRAKEDLFPVQVSKKNKKRWFFFFLR